MFFNKNESIRPEDIYTRTISKSININKDEKCKITINDALFTKIDNKEILLDESIVVSMIEDLAKVIKKNSTKYNPLPKDIIISRTGNIKIMTDSNEVAMTNDGSVKTNAKNQDYIKAYEPKWTIDEVYLDESSKEQILSALTMPKYKEKLFSEWGLEDTMKHGRSLVLNFYGPPGTGKSMMAEAIADYLGKNVYLVNYAELESKYVGETPKNISSAFKRAKENNAVLIFDEADSFLGKRLTNVSQSADYGVNITRSVMLLEIEKFDGVLIFTTNLLNNYDEAFKRRILANVEFKLPNESGRKIIWEKHLPEKLPIGDAITTSYLASKYDGITGADIKDMLLYASVLCLQQNKERVEQEHFDKAYKYIKNRYATQGFDIKHELITEDQYEKEINELSEGVTG